MCSVRLGGSDFTSRASDSGFRTCSVSDSVFARPSASLFGAKFCLSFSKRMIVRPLGDNRRAPRTIVRFNPVDPGFFGLRISQLFGIGVVSELQRTYLMVFLPPLVSCQGSIDELLFAASQLGLPGRRKEEYFKRSQNKLI